MPVRNRITSPREVVIGGCSLGRARGGLVACDEMNLAGFFSGIAQGAIRTHNEFFRWLLEGLMAAIDCEAMRWNKPATTCPAQTVDWWKAPIAVNYQFKSVNPYVPWAGVSWSAASGSVQKLRTALDEALNLSNAQSPIARLKQAVETEFPTAYKSKNRVAAEQAVQKAMDAQMALETKLRPVLEEVTQALGLSISFPTMAQGVIEEIRLRLLEIPTATMVAQQQQTVQAAALGTKQKEAEAMQLLLLSDIQKQMGVLAQATTTQQKKAEQLTLVLIGLGVVGVAGAGIYMVARLLR